MDHEGEGTQPLMKHGRACIRTCMHPAQTSQILHTETTVSSTCRQFATGSEVVHV